MTSMCQWPGSNDSLNVMNLMMMSDAYQTQLPRHGPAVCCDNGQCPLFNCVRACRVCKWKPSSPQILMTDTHYPRNKIGLVPVQLYIKGSLEQCFPTPVLKYPQPYTLLLYTRTNTSFNSSYSISQIRSSGPQGVKVLDFALTLHS